ncbi:MAG: class I SAM-dependent methyltransferase [Parvularcula sp.]|jgi:2-polyprenyl-3-methyl-5-hydroxy-6-metoxy-1,4-benzoquinol methylase|nr:class I SAM-dependent methyltransferase [Parvularcula sp.]
MQRPVFANDRIVIRRSRFKNSLYAEHSKTPEGDYWSANAPDPSFQEALLRRRQLQASALLDRFEPHLREHQAVLDYGCGYGAFTAEANRRGIETYGADLSRSRLTSDAHFVQLANPWELPQIIEGVRTVVLLDVLEHHNDPVGFLSAIRQHAAVRLVVKVPLLEGPLMAAARLMAKMGKSAVLEQLFLVGDVAPHLHYFSREGLIQCAEEAGWRVLDETSLVEVGPEIADRVRSGGALKALGPILAAGGAGAALTAQLGWSDTRGFLFEAA